MVVAMARDPRVLVVKLADRLHNMRTLRFLPPHKQERKARETLEIYAPLAHRLGMNTVKWELEDLAFATLYPKRYEEIVRLVSERQPSRDTYLASVTAQVSNQLRDAKIKSSVTGRPKHYYSIYQKMIVRERDFADIYDLVGVRVLVDSVRDCYATPGHDPRELAAGAGPVQGLHRDAQVQHVPVAAHDGHRSRGQAGRAADPHVQHAPPRRVRHRRALEVQGRRERRPAGGPRRQPAHQPAHRIHPTRATSSPGCARCSTGSARRAIPSEFLDSLRFDLQGSEVFVFTPKGDVVSLPSGSTPVDYAYAVHTEVGHRCIGARVNGRLVPLESPLDNGDTVEIFTSKSPTAGPSRDWMTFVTLRPGAQQDPPVVRQGASRRRDRGGPRRDPAGAAQAGAAVAAAARGRVAADAGQGDALRRCLRRCTPRSAKDTSARRRSSSGSCSPSVVPRARSRTSPKRRCRAPSATLPSADPGVIVKGASDVWVKLARCCTPMPGDPILGFVTRGKGVSVHRGDCPNVAALTSGGDRIVEVEWAPSSASVFLVAIQVEALDRTRLLSDVTRVLSDHHVNILSASVTTTRDRVAVSRFTFEMGETKHLGHLLGAVRGIEGVYDCYRVLSAAN